MKEYSTGLSSPGTMGFVITIGLGIFSPFTTINGLIFYFVLNHSQTDYITVEQRFPPDQSGWESELFIRFKKKERRQVSDPLN